MNTILIVEDEEQIVSFIAKGLRVAGFTPTITASGREAIQLGLMGNFDLIILDLGLPGVDDFDVLEELRGQGVATSIIMLTARSSVVSRIAGLENGADDYVAKPFFYEELLARTRLHLRDSASASQSNIAATTPFCGNLTPDYRTRQITVDGRIVGSSAREFTLAEMFLRNPRRVPSHEQLLSAVWRMNLDPGSSVVDVCMSYLRSKLGKERFEVVRGMGYRLL